MASENISISTESIAREELRRSQSDDFYGLLFMRDNLDFYYDQIYKCVIRRIENNRLSPRLLICLNRLKGETDCVIRHAFIFFALSNVSEARALFPEDKYPADWLDSIFEINTKNLLEGKLIGIVDYVYTIRNLLIMRKT